MNLPVSSYYTERVHRNYRDMFTVVWLLTRACNFSCAYCVDGETSIKLKNGKTKKISSILVGDVLVSYKNKKLKYTNVLSTMNRKVDEYYELELQDGKILKITSEHPLITKRGWIEVKDLKEDDEVLVYE